MQIDYEYDWGDNVADFTILVSYDEYDPGEEASWYCAPTAPGFGGEKFLLRFESGEEVDITDILPESIKDKMSDRAMAAYDGPD